MYVINAYIDDVYGWLLEICACARLLEKQPVVQNNVIQCEKFHYFITPGESASGAMSAATQTNNDFIVWVI